MRGKARRHPLLGWLHLEPNDYRQSFDRLMRERDEAMLVDMNHTGIPKQYKNYVYMTELPRLLNNPRYRKQADERISHLQNKKALIEQEIKPLIDNKLREQEDAMTEVNVLLEMIGFIDEGVPYSEP